MKQNCLFLNHLLKNNIILAKVILKQVKLQVRAGRLQKLLVSEVGAHFAA